MSSFWISVCTARQDNGKAHDIIKQCSGIIRQKGFFELASHWIWARIAGPSGLICFAFRSLMRDLNAASEAFSQQRGWGGVWAAGQRCEHKTERINWAELKCCIDHYGIYWELCKIPASRRRDCVCPVCVNVIVWQHMSGRRWGNTALVCLSFVLLHHKNCQRGRNQMFQSVSCLICKQRGEQGHALQRDQPQGGVTDD